MFFPGVLNTTAAAAGAGLRTYLNYCRIDAGNWEVAVKHGRQKD